LTGCPPSGGSGGGGLGPDFTATLLRPDDLLSLTLGFFNLQLSADKTTLRPIDWGLPAFISADFGPEHVLEQAFDPSTNSQNTSPSTTSPVDSLIAGHSRVVFVVPAGRSIPYTVDGLLTSFSTLQMSVPLNAPPNAGVTVGTPGDGARAPTLAARHFAVDPSIPIPTTPPLPADPAEYQTAIELPTRLIISPNVLCGWAHATGVVTSGVANRTELWHTRLGVRAGGAIDETDANAAARTIRAVWTRDPGFAAAQEQWAAGSTKPTVNPNPIMTIAPPFPASLSPQNRADLVYESGNFGTPERVRSPKAVAANRLILSALGGYLDALGDFGDMTDSGLLLWQHLATLGRDHYVKVVYSGILYPWGHRASLTEITERQLTNGTEALLGRFYVTVSQPTVTYAGSDPTLQRLLRNLQFTSLTITTLSTPQLNPPSSTRDGATTGGVLTLAGTQTPYLFKIVAVDHAGNQIHLEVPAVWALTNSDVVNPTVAPQLQSLFDALGYAAPMNGQRIAFAPESTDPTIPPGKTTFETQSLTHTGENTSAFPNVAGSMPPFVPQLVNASIVVEALRGFAPNLTQPIGVNFDDVYTNYGFDGMSNRGEILLDLVTPTPVLFSASTDKTGGFLAPDLQVTAISRAVGPVAGMAGTIAAGTFSPTDFFMATLTTARIFGIISLVDIIPQGDLLKNAPIFSTQALNQIESLVADANTILDLANQVTAGSTGLPTSLTSILGDISTQVPNLLSAISAFDASAALTSIGSLQTDMTQLPGALSTAVGLPGVTLPSSLATPLSTFAAPLGQFLGALETTLGPLLTAYQQLQQMATTQTFTLDWSTPLLPWPSPSAPIFMPLGNRSLYLKAQMRFKSTGGQPAGVSLTCGIDPFTIKLLGSNPFITVQVAALQFTIDGTKPNVSASLGTPPVTFGGSLSFVQTLTSIIPLSGFASTAAPSASAAAPASSSASAPPGITVDSDGITASYSISVPSLAIGVFALTNISIGASLNIPFIGTSPLNVGFNFCTREEPFVLTVMCIGGGGFFGVTFDPSRIEILEASFEAGAELAVDFGVASGSISAMLGIYYYMEGTACTLTGFFELRGEVDVLGIITASIDLYLGLTYEPASKKVIGTATIEIDVKLFFFSVSVSITCTKRFAGANNDPTFLQQMSPWGAADVANFTSYPAEFENLPGYDPWTEYLAAFAA
jgi:hypothetical protein